MKNSWQNKDSNGLFQENNHKEREDNAIKILRNNELKKKVVQNNMVLYQLYSRYQHMVDELNIFRDKIMDNLRFEETSLMYSIDNKEKERPKSVEFKVKRIK